MFKSKFYRDMSIKLKDWASSLKDKSAAEIRSGIFSSLGNAAELADGIKGNVDDVKDVKD